MITPLSKNTEQVQLDGDFNENSSFGISESSIGNIFYAFTTGIYKNPEFSVIAEICANAWDSHIMAKKTDIPFNIHLPNQLEPWFSVRDFGVSMSHDFMMGHMIDKETGDKVGYTSLCYSTKSKTNKQNGAFGIGRLTCLALNDTYSAICYKDGVKRIYSVFKTENNKPNILLVSNEETTEPDGFEVSVNIQKQYSYHTFSLNAAKILSFYPIKMNVSGSAGFSYSLPEYSLRINENNLNFGFSKDKSSYVVMGVYSYPIETESIDGLTEKEYKIINKGIHLFVKLGECSVTLSRDGLFYDNKTKNKIKSLINDISEKYVELIVKKIENSPSLLEAKKLYFENFSNNGDCYHLTDKGKKNPVINYKGITFSDFHLETPPNSKVKFVQCEFWTNKTELKEGKNLPIMGPNQTIFINDLDKKIGIKKRLKYYKEMMSGNYNKQIFLINDADDIFLNTYSLKSTDFVSLKSIPIPASQNVTRNYDRAKCKIFQYNNECYYSQKSNNWDIPEDLDIEDIENADDACFVIIEDRFDTTPNIYNVKNYFSQLKNINSSIEMPTIYGIRRKEKELIDKCSKVWTPVMDYIKSKFNDIIKDMDEEIKIYLYEKDFYSKYTETSYSYGYNRYRENDQNLKDNLRRLNVKNGVFDIFLKINNYIYNRISNSEYKQILELYTALMSQTYAVDKMIESEICNIYTELIGKIKKQYPLLMGCSILGDYSGVTNSSDLINFQEYLDFRDEKMGGKIIVDVEKINTIIGNK